MFHKDRPQQLRNSTIAFAHALNRSLTVLRPGISEHQKLPVLLNSVFWRLLPIPKSLLYAISDSGVSARSDEDEVAENEVASDEEHD